MDCSWIDPAQIIAEPAVYYYLASFLKARKELHLHDLAGQGESLKQLDFLSRVRIGESSESFGFLNLATSQLSTQNTCFITSLLLFSTNKILPLSSQHKSPLLLHSSSVQLFANSQVILSLLERAKIAVKKNLPMTIPASPRRALALNAAEVHPRNANIPVPGNASFACLAPLSNSLEKT